ncbi:hypothetical protein BH10PLA1_BH10PLA1_07350 [soil metagenome]
MDYQESITALNATIQKQVAERTGELEGSRNDLLVCLAIAGESRDSDTGRHLLRVARYARRLAETLGMTSTAADLIFKASPFTILVSSAFR